MQAAPGAVISASVAADLDAEPERRGRPFEAADVESLTMATYRRGRAVGAPACVRAI
ncbi:MAG: 6-aminohexanoate-cyclic-dimer hydrolase [Phenylobacterium sp.]|nr:6-aminohexanoate-cyclic-dimer hydrolase [Phenylobacterium sp.]